MTMQHSITLNLGPQLSDVQWSKVAEVYRGMDGWIADAQMPSWYDSEQDANYITASAEPSGLVFEGKLDPGMWTGWISVICARLTAALGFPVHDGCM